MKTLLISSLVALVFSTNVLATGGTSSSAAGSSSGGGFSVASGTGSPNSTLNQDSMTGQGTTNPPNSQPNTTTTITITNCPSESANCQNTEINPNCPSDNPNCNYSITAP